MPIIYRIRDWEKYFENSRTRQMDRLNWVPVPNKHDGEGFRTIMAQSDGISIYGAWHLILQVASKCHSRGTLVRDDGTAITPKAIAVKTGANVSDIQRALDFLSQPEVGWIDIENIGNSEEMSSECHPSVTRKHFSADNQNRRELSPPPAGAPARDYSQVPDVDQAVAMTMTSGIAEDFARYVYADWADRGGRDAAQCRVPWLSYVKKRWEREKVEWKNGTHKGKRNGNSNRNGQSNPRNAGIPATDDHNAKVLAAFKRRAAQSQSPRRDELAAQCPPSGDLPPHDSNAG